MKRIPFLASLIALLAFSVTTTAQTTTTGFAPASFGSTILTITPSGATGSGGVSSVFSSAGTEFTFGTGGALVNPAPFSYLVTGPNTATISVPAMNNQAASTTNLVFTGANRGTYTTVSGTSTTTGSFNLAAIPAAAPISNVSSRATVPANGSSVLGFVISGNSPRRVLIRSVGPGLAPFGVTSTLSDPSISLYHGQQLLAVNDSWGTMASLPTSTSTTTPNATGTVTGGVFNGTMLNGSAFTVQLPTAQNFTTTGAFGLTAGSRDAGLVALLPPGAYTVVIRSSSAAAAGSTGEVLTEVYFIE